MFAIDLSDQVNHFMVISCCYCLYYLFPLKVWFTRFTTITITIITITTISSSITFKHIVCLFPNKRRNFRRFESDIAGYRFVRDLDPN